jgi:hypothetical protein
VTANGTSSATIPAYATCSSGRHTSYERPMLIGSSASPPISGGSAVPWYRSIAVIGTTSANAGSSAVSASDAIDSQRQNRATGSRPSGNSRISSGNPSSRVAPNRA